MDAISHISRWIGSKRVDMQHLFEQWTQGCPKTDTAVIRSAKRLTHSHTGAGVSMMDVFKIFPVSMTLSSVSSDNDTDLAHTDTPHGMVFPVVGPTFNDEAQCRVANIPVSASQMKPIQQHRPHKGNMGYTFQYTSPSNTHSMASKGSHIPPELSKSSLWKHISAPPFSPASAKTRNPYNGITNSEPWYTPNLSHINHFAQHIRTDSTEAMNVPFCSSASVFPSFGCYRNGYVFGQASTAKMRAMDFEEHHKVQGTNSESHPILFHFGTLSSPAPVPYQFQSQTFVQVNAQRTHPFSCGKRQTNQDCSPPHKARQTFSMHGLSACKVPPPAMEPPARSTPQPVAVDRQQTSLVDSISHLAHGLETMHVSPNPESKGLPASSVVGSPPRSFPCPPLIDSCDFVSTPLKYDITPGIVTDNHSPSKQSPSKQQYSPSKQQHTSAVQAGGPHTNEAKRKQEDPVLPQPSLFSKPSSAAVTMLSHCQTPCLVPTLYPRKKRKSRPSAEKRRRRRMAADCTITTTMQICGSTDDASKSNPKKLKTGHNNAPSLDIPATIHCNVRRPGMNTTIAFILGLDRETDSDIEEEEEEEKKGGPLSSTLNTCFSFSSCDSDDSDFDSLGSDTCDGVPSLHSEGIWDPLDLSLNPFNPFKLQHLGVRPQGAGKDSLTLGTARCVGVVRLSDARETRQSVAEDPTRMNSAGKHVRFAAADCLVTLHVIEDDLEAYQDARRGHWEELARDRGRFKKRIEEANEAIGHVFDPVHRQLVVARIAGGQHGTDSSQ